MTQFDGLEAAVSKYPKPEGITYSYGTAGFRTKADVLASPVCRVGILATLLARHRGQAVGVMITASHNPVPDNGVKIVEPNGEMMEASWEVYAAHLANVAPSEIAAYCGDIAARLSIDMSLPAVVYYACDTRPSGRALAAALEDGVRAMGGETRDCGILSTPQLHYMVECSNTTGRQATEAGYFERLANAYRQMTAGAVPPGPPVVIDGANGVGAMKARTLAESLTGALELRVEHDGTDGILNHQCGADFVKTGQCAPVGTRLDTARGARGASLDGDADRVVYYYADTDGVFHLMDGDKIASLFAWFLRERLNTIKMPARVGVVQTAYANGASTRYLRETLGVEVPFTLTGVKHLHAEAHHYDIGVYFEANGHGTVLFSHTTVERLAAMPTDGLTPEQLTALQQLRAAAVLANQVVGDALADMLLVEGILAACQMTIGEWDARYLDLPSRLTTVRVVDRSVFATKDADQFLVKPESIQPLLDALMTKYSGRTFVRPSGTEDLVRVYAEAPTAAAADALAYEVACVVYEHAQGTGAKPAPFAAR